MTWNIQSGRGIDGRVDLDRIITEAHRFDDFDVLCLQEVSANYPQLSGAEHSDQFMRLAELLPGYAAFDGIATDAPDENDRRRAFGNMLFSRLSVMQVFRHLLPWPADENVMSMQRVAVEATLQTPSGLIRVTTTHLEYYSSLQRAAQVERLRELHREAVALSRCVRPGGDNDGPFYALPRGAASILLGDFNFGPTSAEYTRLQELIDSTTSSYLDAWTIAHHGKPHDPSLGLYDKVQWPAADTFDFIFVSDDLKERVRDVRVESTSQASDHQPMILVLD